MHSIETGEVAAIQLLVDWRCMLESALQGVPIEQEHRKEFIDSFVASEHTYLGEICRLVAEGGEYKPLHLYRVDGLPRVVFRFLPPIGNTSEYHEFHLKKCDDGRLRIHDAYIYRTGEQLTEAFRRTSLQLLAQRDVSLPERLSGIDLEWITAGPDLQEFDAALASGDPHAVLAAHGELPNELRGHKGILIPCVMAALLLPEREIAGQVFADFERLHGDDPCVLLTAVEFHTQRSHWEEALAAVDRFDAVVGGDPFMHVKRAEFHISSGELSRAALALRAAIQREPTLSDAYWMLIDVSLAQHDFVSTLDGLRALDVQFEVDWVDLRQEPSYSEFVQSPQYAEWLAYLQGRRAPGNDKRPAAEVGSLPGSTRE